MRGRVKSIEGCRGLAAIIVLITHFIVMFYPAVYWGREYTHWRQGLDYLLGQQLPVPAAESGVLLFMIITGFGTYIAIDSANIDIRKYLFLRYFKLLVLTLLGAIPTILMLQGGLIFVPDILGSINTPWLYGWPPQEIDFWHNLLHSPLSSLMIYNGVLWTMPFFFWGTLLSFILTSIFSPSFRENLYVLLGTIVILANIGQYYYIVCATGVFLAYCYKYSPQKFQVSTIKQIVIFLLALYLSSYPTGVTGREGIYLHHGFQQAHIIYHVVGSTMFVMLVLMQQSFVKRIMEHKIFLWLGKYSMGIYLTHYPVLVSLIAFLYKQLPETWSYSGRTMSLFIIYSICGLVAGIPMQIAGNYLCKWMDKRYKGIFRRCCSE